MKTVELRKKLIEQIKLSENKSLLEELYHFLSQENEIHEVYKLNEEQKSAIKEARNQVQNGEFLTNEQADHETEQWLKK